jgi:hypothetical protein
MLFSMKRLPENFVSVSFFQVLGGNAVQSNFSVLPFQDCFADWALKRFLGDLVPICRSMGEFCCNFGMDY